ncbi:FtsW/RodA/SpoVE family cell cycle protein [Paenibacillus sp. SC116]|uniref:FtsW/RodA/SpoVE family cell cycle protein n=1 Tax=Paenibacillus sp. SC116 TaxID=2968986 RepID=UPI00215A8737|nr:FtsW/RodA/SpoVE family cell cycle protein [Paenibacillus sp. SC116]MCR8844672.1 FtsW/RodA/SpoVE family cell cycle protein [Paenibacillus sp. SC116]
MDREANERSLLDSYVNQVEAGIHAQEMRASIRAELEDHLYNQVEEQVDKGMSRSEAEAKAVRQMGSIDTLAEKFNMMHRTRYPWLFWGMIAILLIVSVLGIWAVQHTVTGNYAERSLLDRHFVFLGFGLVIFIITSLIDYRWWRNKGWFLYVTATALFGLGQLIGLEVNGVGAWIAIGGIVLDVGFLTTFSFLLGTFLIISQYRAEHSELSIRVQLILQFIGIIPVLTFVISSQYYEVIVYLIGFILILLIQSFSLKALIIGGIAAISTGVLGFLSLKSYMVQRLETWMNQLLGYNTNDATWLFYHMQQLIVESGWWGKGWAQPADIPYPHSNHMLIVIVHAFGWIAGLGVLAVLFGGLLWLFRSAYQVKQRFGKGLMLFISCYVTIPVIFNVGGLIGIVPMNGANLPLLSYGANSMLIWMFTLGLCTNIYMRKDTLPKHEARWDRIVAIGKGR